MAELKRFKVYHKTTGDLLFEGTAKECAVHFNACESSIRSAALEGCSLKCKYKVVDASELTGKDVDNYPGFANAAKKWDEFCEPIRKKYNIPVYKAKPEVGG